MENQTGIKLQFNEQRNVGRNVAPGRRFIHKQGLPCASQLIRHFLTKRGEPCTRETKRLLHEKCHPFVMVGSPSWPGHATFLPNTDFGSPIRINSVKMRQSQHVRV